MCAIRWEEPPAFRRGRPVTDHWASIAAELKARPGEWALVAEDVWSSDIRTLKKLGCEAVTRGNKKGGRAAKMYARWPVASGE